MILGKEQVPLLLVAAGMCAAFMSESLWHTYILTIFFLSVLTLGSFQKAFYSRTGTIRKGRVLNNVFVFETMYFFSISDHSFSFLLL